jgi:hypothetical protein
MNQTATIPASEIQIQAECFQYAWNHYPLTRRCLFHVPNGGSRNKIEGMQLKASGVVPGVPDLVLLWKGRAYGFELKTPTGKVSEAQEAVHFAWKGQGVQVEVVRSVDQFKNILSKILS